MLLVGDDSPHIDDVVEMNGRMDPQDTEFFKVFIACLCHIEHSFLLYHSTQKEKYEVQ